MGAIALDSMHNRRVVYPGERGRGTVVIEPRENQKGRDEYMRLTGREGGSKAVKKEGRKKTRMEEERERGYGKTEISKAINNELIKHHNWYEEKEFEILQKTKKRREERVREREREREERQKKRTHRVEQQQQQPGRETRELILTTYY